MKGEISVKNKFLCYNCGRVAVLMKRKMLSSYQSIVRNSINLNKSYQSLSAKLEDLCDTTDTDTKRVVVGTEANYHFYPAH
jgi:hypothetical protein